MIVIKTEEEKLCSMKPCCITPLYVFSTVKRKKKKIKRKILGYSCMEHVERVGKMLGVYK